jgi:hypothetical protein
MLLCFAFFPLFWDWPFGPDHSSPRDIVHTNPGMYPTTGRS